MKWHKRKKIEKKEYKEKLHAGCKGREKESVWAVVCRRPHAQGWTWALVYHASVTSLLKLEEGGGHKKKTGWLVSETR